ncbi:16S rRNA (cytidine(1402)-2'-O)-methyltransferase [Suttonella ornithocola]|uniref:Ribosomal RNA small subunit methyltransferase I n=2 Tax=Suttonella ornithocola TaxID=279832 RepID=A0A380MS75_9GAMM|nr:16S rRNA (cytidine(1402)-2'-O)-methyltransferase [Suttonella ornithocola]SUO95138.1 Ribosomal RNA small subunit methyltransferase I [Suttonella ornithocola]
MSGCLYVVATPIGNLEDISQRALAILQQVDAIACEDTRTSRRLLEVYGIDKPLFASHQHNERGVAEKLVARIEAGENIAVISDAGTPVISDPGAVLTQLAHQRGIRVIPIPGANAVITALSASGLPGDRFMFAGFIPAKSGERQRFLQQFKNADCTTVFYETPHRIAETLAEMQQLFTANRPLTIARELTKTFEQIVALTVGSAINWLAEDSYHEKGEFVLLLGAETVQEVDEQQWQSMAEELRDCGVSSKDAANLVAKYTGVNKKSVYNYLIGK